MHTPLNNRGDTAKKEKKENKTGFPKGRMILPIAKDQIQELLKGRSKGRDFLIENLHLIQDRHNQLPVSLLAALAEQMSLSQTEVYEVASFYHHFRVIKENDQPLHTREQAIGRLLLFTAGGAPSRSDRSGTYLAVQDHLRPPDRHAARAVKGRDGHDRSPPRSRDSRQTQGQDDSRETKGSPQQGSLPRC